MSWRSRALEHVNKGSGESNLLTVEQTLSFLSCLIAFLISLFSAGDLSLNLTAALLWGELACQTINLNLQRVDKLNKKIEKNSVYFCSSGESLINSVFP